MKETPALLERALSNECALMIKMISSLPEDDLVELGRFLSGASFKSGKLQDLSSTCENVKNISHAANNFFVA